MFHTAPPAMDRPGVDYDGIGRESQPLSEGCLLPEMRGGSVVRLPFGWVCGEGRFGAAAALRAPLGMFIRNLS